MRNLSIILVKPQMGENIGATARIMKNFGFSDLRLVSPRDGWPNEKAHEMSANADSIIENARIFTSLEDATSDLNILFATAAKSRDMAKDVISPERAAEIISGQGGASLKAGMVFGRESSGLDNEEISHCNYQISIPVSKEYDSLNLAQAVCVICYELFKCQGTAWEKKLSGEIATAFEKPAERGDINEMIKFLDNELTRKNFFQVSDKKPGMMVNIRNIFTRHFYTEQEVRTLRGIFNALRK
jgi:tRNA/rRNA methyltransferase